MSTLSGIKDVDFKILLQLKDYELGRVCQVNKYVKKLCDDDEFWRLKVYSLDPDAIDEFNKGKEFLEFPTWKETYQYARNFRTSFGRKNPVAALKIDQETINYYNGWEKKLQYVPDWIKRYEFLVMLKREIQQGFNFWQTDFDKLGRDLFKELRKLNDI